MLEVAIFCSKFSCKVNILIVLFKSKILYNDCSIRVCRSNFLIPDLKNTDCSIRVYQSFSVLLDNIKKYWEGLPAI